MLFVARQARVSNRFAPRQDRRVNAQSRLLALFGGHMALWLDAYRCQTALGSAVASTPDSSPDRRTITQATAAKQPVISTSGGVKALIFDGVDDGLKSDTVSLRSTSDLTCLVLSRQGTKSSDACIAESGALASPPGGVIFYRTSNRAARSPATYMVMAGGIGGGRGAESSVAYAADVWLQHTHIGRRSAAYADQIAHYGNGAKLTQVDLEASSGNTYADNYFNLFWREYLAPNGSIYFAGAVVELILLRRALDATEVLIAQRMLHDIAGLAW